MVDETFPAGRPFEEVIDLSLDGLMDVVGGVG